jgi:peptide/nickel transport system substrate-binding protein
MRRRQLLAALPALACPAIARAASASTLKFIPQTDVAVLDPVWTTTYPTRDHGYMVFDTLFGMDASYRATPQMLEGAASEDAGRLWRLVLREGLRFHDNTPVLARDCVASIRRWGARDAFGQALLAATDELAAPDDKTIRFRMKAPFPLLPDALGHAPPSMCAIMPERLAQTDPYKQVTEMVGSGPFRFKADERVPGALLVYEKFAGYVPRNDGTPEWTAGPKRAFFDRVEWHILADASTAGSAVQRGEADWLWVPQPDLVPLLRRDRSLVVRINDPTGFIGTMRFNQLIPPFDNAALRRAIVMAVQQSDYMEAAVGEDRSLWRDGVGFFCPGTPMASESGMGALTAPRDLDAAKRAIAASGYAGEKVVLLVPTDIATTKALADVSADLFRRLGLNLDYQAMDWGTLVQRRAKMTPADQGGWNVFHTYWSGLDHFTPAGHVFLRGNGRAASPGWPTSPRIEALRDAWFAAPDLAAQRKLCAEIQAQAFQDVPYVPLGQQFNTTAFRSDLTGVLPGGVPVFWNVRRG